MTRILVAIANYGSKNRQYALDIVAEFQSMPFSVDIVVVCEESKGFDVDVKELIGLPTSDPWSLPFSHRKLFGESASDYDLFIYTEDDIYITERNIRAFIRASENLPDDVLPGFLRFEKYSDGKRNYLDFHGTFHWIPESVKQSGEYVFATLSNAHSACYMLTQDQLKRAIQSGGYLVDPHAGRYDMLCAAATDPYTQCGFTRAICISHLQDFELYHMSNAYLGKVGLRESDFRVQLQALYSVLNKDLSAKTLFQTEKNLETTEWDKRYYETCNHELIRYIPRSATKVLTVGCGSGDLEVELGTLGKDVTAIPLDSVIGSLAEKRGVRVLSPDFQQSLESIEGELFDTIVLPNILHHLANPVELLERFHGYLKPRGVVLGCVPNLGAARRLIGRLAMGNDQWSCLGGNFESTGMHLTNPASTKKWLVDGRYTQSEIRYLTSPARTRKAAASRKLPGVVGSPYLAFFGCS